MRFKRTRFLLSSLFQKENICSNYKSLIFRSLEQNVFRVSKLETSQHFYVFIEKGEVYSCKEVIESHVLGKCQLVELQFKGSLDEGCALDFDYNIIDRRLFRVNVNNAERHYMRDDPYPWCNTEWKPISEYKSDFNQWMTRINDVKREPFWREQQDEGPIANDNGQITFRRTDLAFDPFKGKIDVFLGSSVQGTFGNGSMDAYGTVTTKTFNISDLSIVKGNLMFTYSNMASQTQSFSLEIDDGDLKVKEVMHATIGGFRNGQPQGIIRHIGRVLANKEQSCYTPYGSEGTSFTCRYVDGKAVGPCWRILLGGAFLYANNDNFTGDDVAYIYPDMKLAMVGEFKDGVMIKARKATVTRARCIAGIMEVEFSDPLDEDTFQFDRLTNTYVILLFYKRSPLLI